MIGKILGNRYEIREKIGSGGMADVYKAYCTKLNRFVAVKVLKDQFRVDEEFVNRFNLESQAAASLSHNNIVSVYDVGCEDGIHYIVMEFVEGVTLKEYIAVHGMLPWRQVLDFSIQICDAMDHAHKKGIIHRDIKPQNIMVTSDNTLKVMDFGIARTANKDVTTDNSTAIGTVHYISPEQARGGYVDERSDIYSMGIVMYEMLTGHVPFDGETAVSIAIMHMQNEPVPPRNIVLSIPYELEAICLKAMAKEQSARYKDAGEMLSDLRIVEKENKEPSQIDDYKAVEEYETYSSEPISAPTPVVHHRYKEEKMNKNNKPKTQEQIKADKRAKILVTGASILIVLIFAVIFTAAVKPAVFRDTWFGSLIGLQSIGAEIDKYPDLVGRKLTAVEKEYKNNKDVRITVDSEKVESIEYDEGYIVSQTPEAGEKVTAKKITIKVVVSKGLKDGMNEVPDFVGKHYENAVKTLDKYNIAYKIVPDEDNKLAEGYVISQTPAAGKKLTDKTVVTLYVNMVKEDDKATVPNVLGYDSYDAKSEIEKAGLIFGTVTEDNSDKPKGTVLSQSPSGGSEVSSGYRVNVVISNGITAEEKKTPDTDVKVEQPKMNTYYLTVLLPKDRNTVLVTVKIDGNVIHEQQYDTSTGNVDIRLTSYGTKNVEVYFDGKLSDSKTIDFG